jgi:hypothetical protein
MALMELGFMCIRASDSYQIPKIQLMFFSILQHKKEISKMLR